MAMSRWLQHWRFILGCVLAALPLVVVAELYLRYFPPKDLHPYLGDDSPLTGLFRSDDEFGVAYRSWDDFVADNAVAMKPWQSGTAGADRRPIWAFFGNSFVQADGMLADTVRAHVHDRRTFNLGRNEHLWVRFAQIKLLLDHGLSPERVFVELMPVDTAVVGEQPLATLHINDRGGLTYKTSLPGGPASWMIEHSRTALTAWVRSGRHKGNPRFNSKKLYEGAPDHLTSDLSQMFGGLARLSRHHHVPITVLLIPSYHQVVKGASWGFQDGLGEVFRSQGLDVFDPRDAFRRHPAPAQLYLPDLHLAPEGNRLLLDELLRHVRHPGSLARAVTEDSRR